MAENASDKPEQGQRQVTNGYAKRVVQITDSHLFADESALLAGMNCNDGLLDVMSLVQEQQASVHCVLCTGDIAQDATVAAYRRFERIVGELGSPQRWIPGNHDVMKNIKEALGDDTANLDKQIVLGKWRIIMLNSCVEGRTHGYLPDSELGFLREALERCEETGSFALVALHHNPVPVQAGWLQKHSLKNSEDFFDITDRSERLKGIIFGHIHQDVDVLRGDVRILASPSTSIQFHPDSEEFALDDVNPGYRWLDLHDDGRLTTGVERVTTKSYGVDMSSSGY